LQAAKEVYAMGKKQPGCQEGTLCRAPYHYYENSRGDDMEWGAAELFRVTGEKNYSLNNSRTIIFR
jgi:endoglucanase